MKAGNKIEDHWTDRDVFLRFCFPVGGAIVRMFVCQCKNHACTLVHSLTNNRRPSPDIAANSCAYVAQIACAGMCSVTCVIPVT